MQCSAIPHQNQGGVTAQNLIENRTQRMGGGCGWGFRAKIRRELKNKSPVWWHTVLQLILYISWICLVIRGFLLIWNAKVWDEALLKCHPFTGYDKNHSRRIWKATFFSLRPPTLLLLSVSYSFTSLSPPFRCVTWHPSLFCVPYPSFLLFHFLFWLS